MIASNRRAGKLFLLIAIGGGAAARRTRTDLTLPTDTMVQRAELDLIRCFGRLSLATGPTLSLARRWLDNGGFGHRYAGNCHADNQQLLRHPEMYFFDAEQHHLPHIHAQYQGQQAQFAIDSGEVLAGTLPRAQTRLVQAWIEIHQDELAAAWQMAVNGFRPGKIAPLQ